MYSNQIAIKWNKEGKLPQGLVIYVMWYGIWEKGNTRKGFVEEMAFEFISYWFG